MDGASNDWMRFGTAQTLILDAEHRSRKIFMAIPR